MDKEPDFGGLRIRTNADEITPSLEEQFPLAMQEKKSRKTFSHTPMLVETETIMQRIGNKGLAKLVWKSSRGGFKRIISFPYGLVQWHGILSRTRTREDFGLIHVEMKKSSSFYYEFSPQYRKAHGLLGSRGYGIE